MQYINTLFTRCQVTFPELGIQNPEFAEFIGMVVHYGVLALREKIPIDQ
jgi:hypothetical protein